MKIVIQNARTNLFLTKAGRWVKADLDAISFPTSSDALDFCLKKNLTNVEILVRFGKQIRTVKVRVGENPRELPAVAGRNGESKPLKQKSAKPNIRPAQDL